MWVVIAPFKCLASLSNYCFSAVLLWFCQCSFVLTNEPFSSQLSTQLYEWRFSVLKDWVTNLNVQSKTPNRRSNAGSGPRVCLIPRVASVRCLRKRSIRQAYVVFFIVLCYTLHWPNSSAQGISFIIFIMFFSSMNLPAPPLTKVNFWYT